MTTLRETVFQALDHVVENDYSEFLNDSTDVEIADDLTSHDCDLGGYDTSEVVPHVREWREIHR